MPSAPPATRTSSIAAPCKRALNFSCANAAVVTPCSLSARAVSIALWESWPFCSQRSIRTRRTMRLNDPKLLAALPRLGVERLEDASMAERTSLGIGGTTDVLLVKRHETLPLLVTMLHEARLPFRFLGGGTNLLV